MKILYSAKKLLFVLLLLNVNIEKVIENLSARRKSLKRDDDFAERGVVNIPPRYKRSFHFFPQSRINLERRMFSFLIVKNELWSSNGTEKRIPVPNGVR